MPTQKGMSFFTGWKPETGEPMRQYVNGGTGYFHDTDSRQGIHREYRNGDFAQ